MDREDDPTSGTVETLKFDMPTLLSSQPQSGVDGEFLWPIPPLALALLYQTSAEHGRSIQIKAEGAYGGGLIGKGADKIADLCDSGTADLFVSLGVDFETYGNAFLQIIRGRSRKIVGLRRLPAVTMHRYRDGYLQRVPLPNGDTRKVTFGPDEIVHLREPCPTGGRYSLPNWIGAMGMLELARAAIAYNAAFFRNNAVPEHAIIFKGSAPSREQKDEIRAFFRNEYRGVDQSHRTMLLHVSEETTVEFKQLTADVKDGDFLKLIDAARDRIPTAHGVPPRMLGIVSAGQLGGGSEVSSQLFVFENLTLRPKRRRTLDLARPILRELGLRPGDPDDGLADDQVAFRPLDLTPPGEDVTGLPDLVNSGILTTEEARAFLPGFEADAGNSKPVTRSADRSALDALTALLARI